MNCLVSTRVYRGMYSCTWRQHAGNAAACWRHGRTCLHRRRNVNPRISQWWSVLQVCAEERTLHLPLYSAALLSDLLGSPRSSPPWAQSDGGMITTDHPPAPPAPPVALPWQSSELCPGCGPRCSARLRCLRPLWRWAPAWQVQMCCCCHSHGGTWLLGGGGGGVLGCAQLPLLTEKPSCCCSAAIVCHWGLSLHSAEWVHPGLFMRDCISGSLLCLV